MRVSHVPRDAFLEWAKHSFEAEVSTGFSRAQTFDGPLSILVLTALRGFSSETLRVMARVLPTGAASTGPSGQATFSKLPPDEKQAVEDFQQAVQRLMKASWPERSERIARMRQKETLAEAKKIRKVGLQTVKELAAKWRSAIVRLEPAVWSLSTQTSWGKLSVQFDFVSPMELHYAIFVYDSSEMPIRRHDHYLGVLGVAPSIWSTGSADGCRDKVLKASEFIQWHLAEYEKLMAAL